MVRYRRSRPLNAIETGTQSKAHAISSYSSFVNTDLLFPRYNNLFVEN